MRALLGTIVCKFGSDPATSVIEVAICAKFTDGRTDRQTDRQTDGRRTPRDCISSWNELKIHRMTDCKHLLQQRIKNVGAEHLLRTRTTFSQSVRWRVFMLHRFDICRSWSLEGR